MKGVPDLDTRTGWWAEGLAVRLDAAGGHPPRAAEQTHDLGTCGLAAAWERREIPTGTLHRKRMHLSPGGCE